MALELPRPIPAKGFLIIRCDGSVEERHERPNNTNVLAAIDARSIDVVRIGKLEPNDVIMVVDDDGYEAHAEQRPYGVEMVVDRARKPINAIATRLYHAICHPGTTHQVVGDVAVFHDGDYETKEALMPYHPWRDLPRGADDIVISITAPDFCCGLVIRDDVVVRAAPIIGYMARLHWSAARVSAYCRKRGWRFEIVEAAPSTTTAQSSSPTA